MSTLPKDLREEIEELIKRDEDALLALGNAKRNIESNTNDAAAAIAFLNRYRQELVDFERCVLASDGTRERPPLPPAITAASAGLRERYDELTGARNEATKLSSDDLRMLVREWENLSGVIDTLIDSIDAFVDDGNDNLDMHHRRVPDEDDPLFSVRSTDIVEAYEEGLDRAGQVRAYWESAARTIAKTIEDIINYRDLRYPESDGVEDSAAVFSDGNIV